MAHTYSNNRNALYQGFDTKISAENCFFQTHFSSLSLSVMEVCKQVTGSIGASKSKFPSRSRVTTKVIFSSD